MGRFNALEVCAGGGGQALGLEMSGFETSAALEIDKHACTTLRHNRPQWDVIEADLKQFDATPYKGIDLFAGPTETMIIADETVDAELCAN